jgi:hypothetical protein
LSSWLDCRSATINDSAEGSTTTPPFDMTIHMVFDRIKTPCDLYGKRTKICKLCVRTYMFLDKNIGSVGHI